MPNAGFICYTAHVLSVETFQSMTALCSFCPSVTFMLRDGDFLKYRIDRDPPTQCPEPPSPHQEGGKTLDYTEFWFFFNLCLDSDALFWSSFCLNEEMGIYVLFSFYLTMLLVQFFQNMPDFFFLLFRYKPEDRVYIRVLVSKRQNEHQFTFLQKTVYTS